jgi:hypothetical protein
VQKKKTLREKLNSKLLEKSASVHLIDLIEILNDLKEAGYSELARD